MKLLITGGCGFLGSNLAAEAIRRKYDLSILDNLQRSGSKENLAWLHSIGKHQFINSDIRDAKAVDEVIASFQPDAVFHLAGQVAMTTSIANPRLDFEINALGTLNVLEAIRTHVPNALVTYSSTNKVYGDLEWIHYAEQSTRWMASGYPTGFAEDVPLDFRSPYGCSKGAADQYMLDYHRVFGLNTVVFRHSSMYGGRQFATYDQGWVGWFCNQAWAIKRREIESFTISGDGKQVRDLLHADDMIALYFAALEKKDSIAGQAFNVGGGMSQSMSLIELFDRLGKQLNTKLSWTKLPARSSDQRVFVADVSKAAKLLGWKPKVTTTTGLARMLEWTERYAA
jgi:CDP-paratose 2-epimerase